MHDYKGIYYGECKDQHFYEGGAHFKYIELYRRLEILFKQHNQNNPSLQVFLILITLGN